MTTAPTITVRGPHRTRPIRFAGVHDIGDWKVKLYAVATSGREARTELLAAALRATADLLPAPARTDDRYGIAFVVAHDAADYGFVLVQWWQAENEIHQRILSSPLEDITALAPLQGHAIGCVWELAAVDFERRAWLEHVLANPAGPDIDAYLEARFEDDI